ncbi:MAG: tryptophan 7-halogenase [Acidiferrobacterales bacterium]|nr:tryptophan 7-halogenase [Acidiferrobacterales bacterium]
MKHIIIVGGGSAGWLTAGILASKLKCSRDTDARVGIKITLLESPDISTVGVGEGTWPSMRTTLQEMGVSETEFIKACDVSLKQGTCFQNWATNTGETYYHPFSLPVGFHQLNLAEWQDEFPKEITFEDAVCAQARVAASSLAAKTISTPEYAFNLNYGYHLNAGKFAAFLHNHCTETLGVHYLQDHVNSVVEGNDGEISALSLKQSGKMAGDLFIDCTGFSAALIKKHYGIADISVSHILQNDRALAVTIPYQDKQEIASATHSTAQTAGWVWDIGLSSRRGVGYVYSSQHMSNIDAESALYDYLAKTSISLADKMEPRQLVFSPQYLEKFWHKNCIAIGLSAGFVEPLEASALVLIETSAKAIVDFLPLEDHPLEIAEKKFNAKMHYHWQQIIDFLKLHYVLSSRDESYWVDNRRLESIPDSLSESLAEWQYKSPWHLDAPRVDELFSSASFQYVLYGMGFKSYSKAKHLRQVEKTRKEAQSLFLENQKKTKQWLEVLPSNREFLSKVAEFGMQKV